MPQCQSCEIHQPRLPLHTKLLGSVVPKIPVMVSLRFYIQLNFLWQALHTPNAPHILFCLFFILFREQCAQLHRINCAIQFSFTRFLLSGLSLSYGWLQNPFLGNKTQSKISGGRDEHLFLESPAFCLDHRWDKMIFEDIEQKRWESPWVLAVITELLNQPWKCYLQTT